MNIILVSHCNFLGQSAYHVHSIAKELSARGCACILCVPDGAILSAQQVVPAVPIINYDVALEQGLVFPNGNGPSLIHCWTPREHVRQFTETLAARYGCPYVVHLEDNEREILNRELEGLRYEELEKLHPDVQDIVIPPYRIHPARHWRFMCNAAGITVLIDRLIEHIPDGVPGLVFWPGYDELFSSLPLSDHSELRKKYGVADDAFVVLYCGAFHVINQDEVKQMLLALALLKRQGIPVHLLKTGHNILPPILDPIVLDTFMTDLGFVPRAQLPELLAIADVLIQPGISDEFNDYRFPSKLPESLISGKPVILPRSNLGRFLVDGVEAMITENGRIDELITKITTLFENPELRRTIGRNGQAFARKHLQWGIAAEKILAFYREQCRPRACITSSPHFITNSGEQTDRLEKDVKGMVTVIIVNYNGKKYLEACFNSLLNMDRDNISLQIVMVDNLSIDGSVSFVKEKFPEVIIVENDVNNFARALNLGIEHAGGDYIAFLNNDTIVDKKWLEGLLAVIDGDERIGAVQSKILFSDGEIINSVGVEDVKDFYFKDIGFDERDHGQYQSAKEIDYFTGGSVLLRRACIEGVGNIDEDFIMFFEDIDYSIRCRKAGWKLFYSPESVVYHKYHGSASSELSAFFCSRNRLLCLAKHFPLKLPGSIKTSQFYVNQAYENLYQSLIQAARKLIADHSAATSLKVLAEIKDVMIEIYGMEKTRYFFSQIEVLTGLKQIKMGIYDHLLKLTDADMLRASELVKEPSFYLSQISGPIYMAAMLDRPVLAVFNQVSEHDRKERLEQIDKLNGLLAEAVKQAQSLTEWATSAETYAKSLAEASEADRAEAVKQVQSLTEWATSAETYAKSLEGEVTQLSTTCRAHESEIKTLKEQLSLIQSHWLFRLMKLFKRNGE